MQRIRLGHSDLQVSPICLGTMTFGEQVDEAGSFAILDRAVERGVDFLDTAEMYPVPPMASTYNRTETILGRWFAARPGMRQRVCLATKVSGPARGMNWIRGGALDLTPAAIEEACNDSLRRLQTDVIDLYQIHWPNRNALPFGSIYFDPTRDIPQTSIHDQLEALGKLVRAGKVRAIGLSNETAWGVAEFVRVAEQHGLARIASVQNPYCLVNRAVDNGLDETLYRSGVGLLAYSPLAFGLLSGKYDEHGFEQPGGQSRMHLYERFRQQRWGRPATLEAARRYNAIAREHGQTPTDVALAFCYRNWRVASTIIGVTTLTQLDECIDAWDVKLTPELLAAIDQVRWDLRDPAQ